jgi:hypothetical protein
MRISTNTGSYIHQFMRSVHLTPTGVRNRPRNLLEEHAHFVALREEEGVSAGVDVARMDWEHRLAARERELRALAAEKDVLAQQARAAWNLLDERTAAAHELEVQPPCQLAVGTPDFHDLTGWRMQQ